MKVKRNSQLLKLTKDYVVVDCRQQGVLPCRKCGLQTLIVISSHSHQLRWCSHCVTQLTVTSFEQDKPTQSQQDINKWVDNGSVQLIETPDATFVITFREPQQTGTVPDDRNQIGFQRQTRRTALRS